MAGLEETSYHLALRALEEQERLLSELRTRTGTLITAASLIASFVGAQSLARGGLDLWTGSGLLAFSASLALSVYVLLPKEGLIFALDGPEAYVALYEVRGDEPEIFRRLTYWLQGFRAKNQTTIARLTRRFTFAGLALLLEIALLAVGFAVD